MEIKKINLRAMEPEDLEFLYEIENDEEYGTSAQRMFHIVVMYFETI